MGATLPGAKLSLDPTSTPKMTNRSSAKTRGNTQSFIMKDDVPYAEVLVKNVYSVVKEILENTEESEVGDCGGELF